MVSLDKYQALGRYYAERNEMAKQWELPREWVICPHCAEQSWVLPPHANEPCPLLVQTMEQFGMKLDAERMMAVRAGVSMEEAMRRAQELEDEE